MRSLAVRLGAVLWWLVPLAGAIALLGWETDWGAAVDRLPEPVAAPAPTPVDASLLPEFTIDGGVATRTETVQRTLFNPTRRAAPVLAQDGAVARMQRGQFALTGTTLVEGKNTAFLRELAGNRSRRVQAGETINGILVAEVKPDRVKLTLGDESEELVLRVATNPRPTVAPVAPGQAPPVPGAPALSAQQLPGVAQDAAQSLAERRRAARAVQAAGGQPPGSGVAVSGTPPRAPMTAAVPVPVAPAATGAPETPDPRWQEVYRRYQERQR